MKRDTNTESLKDVIDRFLKQNKLDKKYDLQSVVAIWENLLGKLIADKTRELYIHNKTLFVKLESSVIRNELSFAKNKLIKKINQMMGKEIINEIVFR